MTPTSCNRHLAFAGLVAVTLAAMAQSAVAQSVTLEATLEGVRNSKGAVWFCLWREDQADFPKCNNAAKAVARIKATADKPTVTFKDVAPGTYAITALHDKSGTGDGEFNFAGMPKSGVGVSTMTSIGMTNRPTFDKAKFTAPDTKALSLKAHYLF